jgi:hypothetical protein
MLRRGSSPLDRQTWERRNNKGKKDKNGGKIAGKEAF